MDGDERVRHCSQCSRNVYDLSALTRRQAEDLVFEEEGRLCVRFYRRADGTVLTSDCPEGARTWWRRASILIGTLSVGILAFFGILVARVISEQDDGDPGVRPHRPWQNVFQPPVQPPVVVMGAMCPPELPKDAPPLPPPIALPPEPAPAK